MIAFFIAHAWKRRQEAVLSAIVALCKNYQGFFDTLFGGSNG